MDFRIPRSSIKGMGDSEFFWALIEPLWPDASVHDELRHIAAATPGQRALYVVTLFVREVDNGGLEQFFYNSSGIYAEAVLAAFRLLGADSRARAMQRVVGLFPDRKVPVKRDERIRALRAIPKKVRTEAFGSLEQEFFDEERLWPLFRKYVKAHPRDFFID